MKNITVVISIMAGAILMVGGQATAAKTSIELGEKLFHDTTLGGSTNDKSCSSCHAAGEGLEDISSNKKLTKTINQCVTEALNGNKIDGRSAEMRSLKMYATGLSAK